MSDFYPVFTQFLRFFLDAPTSFALLLMVAAAFPMYKFVIELFKSGVKISLRVAVIGLPRAGKTTLIAKIFDTIMSTRYAKFMTVNGVETIDRITHYLNIIQSGGGLSPSTDNDVFAFRYIYKRAVLGLLTLKYDVEIADFPGEYSESLGSDLSQQSSFTGLYKKEFFSWIVRADRYVFAVDCEPYLQFDGGDREQYARSITLKIKNAVLLLKQELLDESVYSRPCALVFTKADVFEEVTIEADRSNILEAELNVKAALDEMLGSFKELIQFLESNFKSLRVLCHSSKSKRPMFTLGNELLMKHMSPL